MVLKYTKLQKLKSIGGRKKINKMKIKYDQEADVLNIEINDKEYFKSIELPNGIVVDIAKDGSITSIEVLNASRLFSGDNKKVIEMANQIIDDIE